MFPFLLFESNVENVEKVAFFSYIKVITRTIYRYLPSLFPWGNFLASLSIIATLNQITLKKTDKFFGILNTEINCLESEDL